MLMRFIFLLLLSFVFTCEAAPTLLPDEIPLKISFNFIQRDKQGNDKAQMVETTINVNPRSHQWFTLNDLPFDDKNNPHIVVLAKIEKATTKEITLNFIVLDLQNKPLVISEPKMITNYGQQGTLAISTNTNQHLNLSILAGNV